MKTCYVCGRPLDADEEESGECCVCYGDRLDMLRDDERGNGEGAEGVCEDYSNLN